MALSAPRALRGLFRQLCTTSARAEQSRGVYRTPGPSVTRLRRRDRVLSGPYEAEGIETPTYPKRRSPYRRTSALIDALNQEEALRLVTTGRAVLPRKIPDPRSGNIIRVTYATSLEEGARCQCFTGICIAVRNRGIGGSIILRNVVDGVPIERGFPMYSPLIIDAEVIGKRKVRRAKLYYLRDKPLRESTIPGATSRPK